MAKIFTIGHSNHKWSDFISILKDNHVNVVVDVRRYSGSRACPQFNKERMIMELKKENLSALYDFRLLRNIEIPPPTEQPISGTYFSLISGSLKS
jgi:hypothetical protein